MADAAAAVPGKETKKQEKIRKKAEKAAIKAAMKAAMVESGLATAEAASADPPAAVTAKAARETLKAAKKSEKEDKLEGIESLDISSVARGEAGELTSEQVRVAAVRASTGVLSSMKDARDLKFVSFSVMVGGNQLVTDCDLELNYGCRYGLIGANGSGKSNVLAAIAQRDIPLPEHVDIYHLHEEAPADELTGVEAVVKHVVDEAKKLEDLSERIMEENGMDDERLEGIYERLDELDPTGSEPRARLILSGLGFADHLIPMDRKTKHMSGGWRMRVSLAKALFAAPSLLLLDEPTNHLDLEACVWLEEHLASYSKCLVVVSHSEDFLNAVTTNTIWLKPNPGMGMPGSNGTSLTYYGGNYDLFIKVTTEDERVQSRLYEKQRADIEKLEDFVRVNKANGAAASAKSKQRVLDKIYESAVPKPSLREPSLVFKFVEMEKLPPPVMPFDDVSFSYSGLAEDYLYDHLNLAVDYDSRVALVGPNGCGKSTLVKLMTGELQPTRGQIKTNPKLLIAKYHQHSADVLDNNQTPLGFMRGMFPPEIVPKDCNLPLHEEHWRGFLTNFGFSTKTQTSPIGLLSDGQKSRLVFAMLALAPAGVLLLDEPTNHLDLDAVEGLALAINSFKGGVVLVSHDFRLIDQVADEIWVCENKGVTKFSGEIRDYKKILSKKMAKLKIEQRS